MTVFKRMLIGAAIIAGSFTAAVLQFSFFPAVAIAGATPNLVLALFFCLIFFDTASSVGWAAFAAAVCGFFLDIFSNAPFGVFVLILLVVYAFQRLLSYFLRGDRLRRSPGYFIALFLASFLLYAGLRYSISLFLSPQYSLNVTTVISGVLSAAAALVGFLTHQWFSTMRVPSKQLTLFK
ncbi:MAG: hypothetical protein ACREHG_05640 [Candidatus Saccharimonadales bacterium]